METRSLRTAVVGAGPAGLAAALRLHAAGASVTVHDAAGAVGGRTRSDLVDGWRIDPAVQLYGSAYATVRGLLRAAGAEPLLVRSPGRDALWRKGRAHEVVYGSPTSMLASGALPLALKLKMGAKYLPFLQRHGSGLDLGSLEQAAAAGLDGESIAAWGRRELGQDFVDLLAAPLLSTLYGMRPDEASSGFYHALAKQGLNLEVLALRGGADGLCRSAADALTAGGASLRLSTPVASVEAADGGVRLSGDGWSEDFDGAVVATPAAAAARFAKFLTPDAEKALAAVRMRPAASLALLLDRPVGVGWFGLSFAAGEGGSVAAVCVEENKVAGLVPPGKGLAVVFAGPHAAQRLQGASADDAAALLMPDVARVLPSLPRTVLATRLYTWEEGWTLFGPGDLGRLPMLRRHAWESSPRAVLAGDWLYAPTVEGAATAGLAAADRLLARLR
ncbi:FAD-dependent oxidoreductase [Longimicrobium sp.]|uniref:FAD-dependent oxidoreductase n=1 Tax=Longimicrobium sp. TaxID=2029185 RepID=UPI002E325E76|nr:FAD-dependent oxidoreductase [Longimicrobium sp.]HEX6036455.1 FAD-dependent oxidoreductase [Longimicrobium sp.]